MKSAVGRPFLPLFGPAGVGVAFHVFPGAYYVRRSHRIGVRPVGVFLVVMRVRVVVCLSGLVVPSQPR